MKIRDKVLIVEDEQNIKNFMSTILAANGFDTLMAGSAKEALSMISSHCPDLIILDLGLPDMDGMEVLKQVRAWSSVPVIVVSARTHEGDKVAALDLGADDYIEKPFGTSELLARIRERFQCGDDMVQTEMYSFGNTVFNYTTNEIRTGNNKTLITSRQAEILRMLAKNVNVSVDRDSLLNKVWGASSYANSLALNVQISYLRRALRNDNTVKIDSLMRKGYMLREDS